MIQGSRSGGAERSGAEAVQVEGSGQILGLFWKWSRWDSQDVVGGETQGARGNYKVLT